MSMKYVNLHDQDLCAHKSLDGGFFRAWAVIYTGTL